MMMSEAKGLLNSSDEEMRTATGASNGEESSGGGGGVYGTVPRPLQDSMAMCAVPSDSCSDSEFCADDPNRRLVQSQLAATSHRCASATATTTAHTTTYAAQFSTTNSSSCTACSHHLHVSPLLYSGLSATPQPPLGISAWFLRRHLFVPVSGFQTPLTSNSIYPPEILCVFCLFLSTMYKITDITRFYSILSGRFIGRCSWVPPHGRIFRRKSSFKVIYNAYSSSCAFVINDDGAVTLPSPFQYFWIHH